MRNPITQPNRRPWAVAALVGLLAAAGGCRDSAPDDLIGQEDTTVALVFVKTEGEETLNRSRASGNLYRLAPISPDGEVTPITNFTGAAVFDPCVSFDGERILFSLRRQGDAHQNIWEIRADGTGLRQVTSGGGDDFDPLYLPDGRILFTSSRHGGMDEYNHAPAEVLYTCNADGSDLKRRSFNMSDDFDPALLPDGRVIYTRWEHFGTFNRFPIFVANPDGTHSFHKYGPHNRNFFHPQVMPDGRIIAIESTMVNEDSGPIAVLKLETGPADPAIGGNDEHWNVLTDQVNNDGAPWPHGVFKYPFPLGGNRYVASYTLPAAAEEDVDYGLYTFTLEQTGSGTDESPATFSISDLTFLYNDPNWNEYDAQLLAPHAPPPVVDPVGDGVSDFGIFLGQDVFNRSTQDGQEVPVKGVDPIEEIAVFVGIPTARGEANDYSANEFEKRALLGFAPVYPDGSFKIKVPANTPVSFATVDSLHRAIVTKRTWLYVQPGETANECVGCHQERGDFTSHTTNPVPLARSMPASDVNVKPADYTYINYRDQIAPIVAAKCVGCHFPTYVQRDTMLVPDGPIVTVTDTIPPPGFLDLTAVPDTTGRMMQVFPRAYINLSGESETSLRQAVVPAFPRRSPLIDYIHGVGEKAGDGAHPASDPLTAEERELFTLWVLLGAQYR
ncbi:PD40 domain-containing protein [bacterium]|nr:PD40 domain-containing protein [bacterium]